MAQDIFYLFMEPTDLLLYLQELTIENTAETKIRVVMWANTIGLEVEQMLAYDHRQNDVDWQAMKDMKGGSSWFWFI